MAAVQQLNATSKDVKVQHETGTPTFAGTTVSSEDGEDKNLIRSKIIASLLDNDGNEVTNFPAYALMGTTEIGTHTH